MRLSKLRKQPDDMEGWTLTLADMMTLLLCFFVILLSISSVDVERYDKVSDSMLEAMARKKAAPPPPPPDALSDAEMAELAARKQSLDEIMQDMRQRLAGEQEHVQLDRRDDGIVVNLRGPAFFELGSAELTPRARGMLTQIGRTLLGSEYRLVIEGHTDDIPIRSEKYPSNWELSAARAATVARSLIGMGIAAGQMEVVGLADTRPLVHNVDDAGVALPGNRSLNRRVVILVKPNGGDAG